jgi:pyruvate formate lyase activating enzyme
MLKCKICGKGYEGLSSFLGVCRECIRKHWKKAKEFVDKAFTIRKELELPTFPPRELEGIECKDCGNRCKIGEAKKGYCGLVVNENGKLKRILGTKKKGLFHYYYDPHPTNCTAAFWCGSTGIGYPKYSIMPKREVGFLNLSVFSGSCNYFCLYCQNTSWHEMVKSYKPTMTVEELVNAINRKTTCACFFGGSASVQPEFIFSFMKLARKRKEELNLKVFRICFEDSGNFSWYWLKKIAKLSLESGGGIKFDLKTAPRSNLNLALSGISNEQAYENFERLIDLHHERPEVPFLRASTLLVPHYIDLKEIEGIAKFIADLDKSIPYSLLAFYPHYKFFDVGFTSRSFALKCLEVCRKIGLKNVRVGNVHLLVG